MSDAGRSSVEKVASVLRAELLDGDISPGSWLREELLADRFGVGRYTVRAALARLVSTGLLRHERHRGVCVPELSTQGIDDLYSYRSVVELGALQIALNRRADFGDVETAVRHLENLDDDAPWHDVTIAHGAIHHAIVAAAGNPRLLAAFDACRDELHFLTAFVRTDLRASNIARLHRSLMKGLLKGGESAVKALNHDIEESGRAAMARAVERHTRQISNSPQGRPA